MQKPIDIVNSYEYLEQMNNAEPYKTWISAALTSFWCGLRALIHEVGQISKTVAQRLAPAMRNGGKALIIGLDPALDAKPEDVLGDDRQIERHADREVGADRRIHRHAHRLDRVANRAFGGDDPVEDGLAIFVLANLEKGRVARGFDEIAGGVDQEEAEDPAFALACKQNRGIGHRTLRDNRLAMLFLHLAHFAADKLRHAKHRLCRQDRFLIAAAFLNPGNRATEVGHDALREREITRGQHRDHPLSRHGKAIHFGKARDIVHARVGPRVRKEHDP